MSFILCEVHLQKSFVKCANQHGKSLRKCAGICYDVAVRKVQEEILLAYDKDFAKHAPPSLLPKIRLLWNAIPGQLAKENKVMAERNLQAKSLKSYIDRFASSKSLRVSLSEHGVGKSIDEIPLYAVGNIVDDYLDGAGTEE